MASKRVRDLKAFFEANPNKPISAITLEPIGGRLSWRTRVSDVRRLYGMTIKNKVHTWKDAEGRAYRYSSYCYLP